jgi:tight adherence protein B
MPFLVFGLLLTTFALALLVFALTAAPVDRVPIERRTVGSTEEKPVLALTTDYIVATVDRLLRQSSWVPFRARELELAGLKATPGSLVVTVTAIAVALLFAVTVITGSFVYGVLIAIFVPVVAKLILKIKTGKRRKAFKGQLDETLQIIASALRAGHSFTRALDAVATESESPTAEEFARVINENRIGRDLIVALQQTADRMESEDFRWVAEAVAVHRDTGGNLNEVLDRVGQTMRERNQIRQEVETLAAEGKFSGIVLMALPFVVAGAFSVMTPGYMTPMFTTTLGKVLLAGSLVLYIVGGLWIKKIVNVKF